MESSLVERYHLTFVTLYSHHHLTRIPPPIVKDHSHVQGFCHWSILLVLFSTQKTLSKSCVQRPQPQPQLAGKRQSHKVFLVVLTGPQPHLLPSVQEAIMIQVERRGQDGGSCLT